MSLFSTTFERPIGAAADAKELEYITALHQTTDDNDDAYLDGSIDCKDVKYYLMSRYGIDVSKDDIKNRIFHDFAGGSSDDDCIDICEIVAMLLIPFFVKNTKGDLRQTTIFSNSNSINRAFESEGQLQSYIDDLNEIKAMVSKNETIHHILKVILADSIGSTEPQRVTPELIKAIFARYGESALMQDEELIQQMIEDVTGGNPDVLLDVDSLSRALSNDVLLYDVKKESRVSTFYEDVFGTEAELDEEKERGTENSGEASPLNKEQKSGGKKEDDVESPKDDGEIECNNIFTFSQIDLMSDTMRSKFHLSMAYLSFIFTVFMFRTTDYTPNVCKGNNFGCSIANSVFLWFMIMGITMGIGVPFILSLSSGNSLRGKSWKNVFFGFAGIGVFVIVPMYVPFNFHVFSNKQFIDDEEFKMKDETLARFYQIVQSLIFVIHLLLQTIHFLRVLKPTLAHSRKKILSFVFTRGTVRETFLLKLAASMKTHKMVKNALDLHYDSGKKISVCSSFDEEGAFYSTNTQALLNYSRESDKTEEVGGLIWCWKSFVTRSLIHKEGVIVNSRLMLCNIGQFFLVVILLVYLPEFTIRSVTPTVFPKLQHHYADCDQSTFDPDRCFYPSFGNIPSGVAICEGIQFENPGVCNSYFDTIKKNEIEEASAKDTNLISSMCDGMRMLLDDDAGNNPLDVLYSPREGEEYYPLSYQLVNYMLCEGLGSFNQTLMSSMDVLETSTCQFENNITCTHEHQPVANESATDALLISYELKYKAIMAEVVECISDNENQIDPKLVNDLLFNATNSLRGTLLHTSESLFNLINPTLTLDDAKSKSFNDMIIEVIIDTLGSSIGNEIVADQGDIFNLAELVDQTLLDPEYSLSADILLMENSMKLIDTMFEELNSTLISAFIAVDTKLETLPTYIDLPNVPVHALVESFCTEIYSIKDNTVVLVDSIGSTEDYYCRAHLTACTGNLKFCLLGMDKVLQQGIDSYFPYQFSGSECEENENIRKIIETKESLEEFSTYFPGVVLINVTIVIAVLLSIAVLLFLSALFIPNVILTSLKYRSGVLPSLRDKDFKKMRSNLMSLTFLVPIVFWSAFAMTFIVFFAVWLVVFILCWKGTRRAVVGLFSMLIGIVITVLVKILVVLGLNKYNFTAFYRKNPALVNVSNVALECWQIFLSIAFVISRAGILIFMSLLFIGRIDRTVLAEDLDLDKYPHVFRQAILASDAHRHPYIERLGFMYLMKIKHGKNFGKRSNSTWRLLFVFALMPWLQKYRIAEDIEDIDTSTLNAAYETVKKKNEEVSELKAQIEKLEKQLHEARGGKKLSTHGGKKLSTHELSQSYFSVKSENSGSQSLEYPHDELEEFGGTFSSLGIDNLCVPRDKGSN